MAILLRPRIGIFVSKQWSELLGIMKEARTRTWIVRISLRFEARGGILSLETVIKRLIFLERLSLKNDSSDVTGNRLNK